MAARQWVQIVASAAVAVLLCVSAAPAAMTERIVGDWRTGLALHGFDPVAYFVDEKAVPGRPELEAVHAGMTWRFRNEGNRSAFTQDPQVYTPRFGGYDPLALGRGVATPGHPELFVIIEHRLILFHSPQTRAAFLAAPEQSLDAAEVRWPEVAAGLIP